MSNINEVKNSEMTANEFNPLSNFDPSKINEDELFVPYHVDEKESEHLTAEPYSYWKSVFRVFFKKPSAIIGIVSLIIMLLCMFVIPFFADPAMFKANLEIKNAAPSWEHLFGTDKVGRDLFFMCFQGLRISFLLALISSVINVVIGTLVGLAWGFFKKFDRIMIEIYNLIQNIPSLLIYMLFSFIFATIPGMTVEIKLVLALTITGWLGMALFIRNQTLIITNREYNVASLTLGTPPSRIMMKNLLPYLLAVIVTEFSLFLPGMISSEVSMSYFGVGLPNSYISIGALLQNGYGTWSQYPWQLLAPAGILAYVIFTFYLLGLAFSDSLDPKKHR